MTKSFFEIKEVSDLRERKSKFFKDVLNPDIWQNDVMKPEVRERLLKIAQEFITDVENGAFQIPVVDIIVVGSNASYNYTENSDIDIHIVADIQSLNLDNDFFVVSYFDMKRKMFVMQHNITIKGHQVELYIEDSRTPGIYNGVYSLTQNLWLQKPNKMKVHINTTSVKAKYEVYKKDIENIINISGNMESAVNMYKQLFKIRKEGLQEGGEFSVENLVFKQLRNDGYITALRNYMYQEKDKDLSLESVTESFKNYFNK